MTNTPPSFEELYFARAAKKRQTALENNFYKRLEKSRYLPPSGEDHPCCKYKDWQIIIVRSMAEANKRVPPKGGYKCSWNMMGQRAGGIPYNTIKKIILVPTYRKACIPTEAQIEAFREQFMQAGKAVQRMKRDRAAAKAELLEDINSQGTSASRLARSTANSPVERLWGLCSQLGKPRPKTVQELEGLLTETLLPKADALGLTSVDCFNMLQATTKYIENKSTNF